MVVAINVWDPGWKDQSHHKHLENSFRLGELGIMNKVFKTQPEASAHGPKLGSRHSPLALGTLVWCPWCEASSCRMLWASETAGSTKEKKRSVWEFLLLHILASIWCCHCFNSNYRGPRGRREKERVWENFWRDYGWKFPQHGNANSQSNPRGTKSPI